MVELERELFFNLLNNFGVLGSEEDVLNVAKKELEKYTNKVYRDKSNNLIAEFFNPKATKHVVLDAHLDQVSLIVTHICKGGFIKFSSCGGIDSRILPGKLLKILGTKEIFGIVSNVPPHLSAEKDDYLKKEDLVIDTGLSEEKVKELVPIGSLIVFSEKAQKLLNNRIVSKAIDNRAGVMTLLHCAKMFSEKDFKDLKVSILLSTGEEINALGAKTGSFILEPDIAIVVDTSFAKQPKVDEINKGELGQGPMIGISPCLCKEIYNELISLARKEKIPYQFEVMPQKTGTNADHILSSKGGIKTGLLSVPIRYMHTMSEVLDLKDIEHTSNLLVHFIERLFDQDALSVKGSS